MGLRFRRSVRLFPGVRLNFSRSGVSTSIGLRGATVTLGPGGTYANVGIPGTGISYRSRLGTPTRASPVVEPSRDWQPPTHPSRPGSIFNPGIASIPGTEVEVASAEVSTLTSPGLGELKQLINEATLRHVELRTESAKKGKALDKAARRLRRAQFFIIRLFTASVIPRLVEIANKASDEFDETRSLLEGCFVEVDFAFDDQVRASYAALVRSFENLRSAQRIWDITTTAAVDRVAQRTTASNAITRVPVSFDYAKSEVIRCQYPGMRLGNAGGRDLQIFPGFVMMRDMSRDFALIEFSQFQCQFAQSNFIEEEGVPSDAQQVGATWKRANKDGSRDRRFNNNYQVPVMRYAALALSSPTGLSEVYQISCYDKAKSFAEAILTHKRALDNLNVPTDLPLLAPPSDSDEEAVDQESEREPTFAAKRRTNLALDWIGLALIVVSACWGSLWLAQHWDELKPAITPSPTAPVSAAPSAPLLSRPVAHISSDAHSRHARHHVGQTRRHN